LSLHSFQSKLSIPFSFDKLRQFFTFTSQESFEAASALSPTPFSSLMLDDVFFVVKKCVRRAMSSQSIDGVCAVANNACTILETDFCGLLQTQLRCERLIYLFVYCSFNEFLPIESLNLISEHSLLIKCKSHKFIV